ncbi:C40 family peptidase [Chitinibacter fontanus]|uniref:C40 family peptidase n=1 Tax=Chitinibacter fontanus TaxID=1737446 RepID=A0A7D5VB53_9NEIS|nr:C40 family peptidase [Chitinibacter fontanus]QLI82797.1 C40 family peptidase [Chitinibacter fontanus]
MKWIIILATVLSCTNQLAHADQDMPLGDTNPSSGLRSATTLESAASSDNESPAVAARPRSKPKSTAMPKGTDYQPAQDLLLSAMSLIGVKYTWGGNTPEAGLDCSGFIKYVFQNSMNITLPRTALGMSQTGQNVDKSELKPGDLVFFNTLGRTFSHVGIYLGDNRFIHSPRSGRNIEVANMNLSYWQSRFNGARRVADSGSQGLNVSSLLAAGSGNKAATTTARNSAESSDAARSNMQCKKITVGKGKKKKTVTQCTQQKAKNSAAANKPSVSKSSAKASKNKSANKKDAARSKTTTTKKTNKSKKQ